MDEFPEVEAGLRKGPRSTVMKRFSEISIRRRLLYEAVQHPATLLPLTLLAMSLVYLLLVSPVLGWGFWAMAVLAASGILAAAGLIWRYFLRYSEEYARRWRDLMDLHQEERRRWEQENVRRLRESLEVGFSGINLVQGLAALRDLNAEYDGSQLVLGSHADTDPLGLSLVPSLVEETYRRGLSTLADALELGKVANTPGKDRLEREIVELEQELVDLNLGGQKERARIKAHLLASQKQRLAMVVQLQLSVDQLLYQAHRCAASLHRTRIELSAVRIGSSETSVDAVIAALQGTIDQVKEVQDELRRLGY